MEIEGSCLFISFVCVLQASLSSWILNVSKVAIFREASERFAARVFPKEGINLET